MDDSKRADAPDQSDEQSVPLSGRSGGGDSGGGAYPNPHGGKQGGNDGFMGHGGQTEMAYHGQGRLGEEETGGNANSPASKAGAGEEDDREDRD
jgi:hypothetical protein